MSKRFPHALAALKQLKVEHPEHASEVDIACQMILGKRPNIEDKYDALLLKLDRTYSELSDLRDHIEATDMQSTLAATRRAAKIRVKFIRRTLASFDWMRARNSDLIKALKNSSGDVDNGAIPETKETELPPEVS